MMKMQLIDSHSHVQFPVYDQDRNTVVARALAAGVGMVNVGTEYSTSADAIRLAAAYPDGLWATVGFHPNHLDPNAHHDPQELHAPGQREFDYAKFLALAQQPTVVAIGECGLDYFRSGVGSKDIQRDVLAEQILLAEEVAKPLVIHCRQAFPDLISTLSAHRASLARSAGAVHFFSGSWGEAQRLLDLGFYLGFGGVITFARDYDEVVKNAPIERLLVETDAPYVAPVPFRGKRNEPAFIVETARKIGELRGISYDEVVLRTTANARELFQL